MDKLVSLDEVKTFINSNNDCMVIFKTNNCGVCEAVIQRVGRLLEKYKNFPARIIYIEDVPAARGEFMVFAAPTILIFKNGKEQLRESRFIMFDRLESYIENI